MLNINNSPLETPLRNVGATSLLYFKYWQNYLNTLASRNRKRKKTEVERNKPQAIKWNKHCRVKTYHEITAFIVLICNKERVYEIYFQMQTANNGIYTLDKNFIFNLRIFEIFSYLLSFANFTFAKLMFAFATFSHTNYL